MGDMGFHGHGGIQEKIPWKCMRTGGRRWNHYGKRTKWLYTWRIIPLNVWWDIPFINGYPGCGWGSTTDGETMGSTASSMSSMGSTIIFGFWEFGISYCSHGKRGKATPGGWGWVWNLGNQIFCLDGSRRTPRDISKMGWWKSSGNLAHLRWNWDDKKNLWKRLGLWTFFWFLLDLILGTPSHETCSRNRFWKFDKRNDRTMRAPGCATRKWRIRTISYVSSLGTNEDGHLRHTHTLSQL